MADPYIDPRTGILRNKLGIETIEVLDQTEFRQSVARMTTLTKNPVRGNFDRQHLERVHERLFGDIYDWAGKVRTVAMSKKEPILAGASVSYPSPNAPQLDDNLDARLDYAFSELARERHLKGIDDPARFARRFTHHLAQVWEVHPFREGNTRTVTAFMGQVAKTAGYSLDVRFPHRRGVYRDALVMATAGNDSRHLEAHVKEGLGIDPGVLLELPTIEPEKALQASAPSPSQADAELARKMDAQVLGAKLSEAAERKVRARIVETAPEGMRAEFERLTEKRIRLDTPGVEPQPANDRKGRQSGNSEPDLER